MELTNNTVHSVDKALAILDILSCVDEIGISELNRQLGFGKGTIYRLLTTLRVNGFVEQTETEKYRASLKLFEMGNKVVSRLGIRKIVNPYLEQIARDSKETVNLAILDGAEVIYIDRIESLEPLRYGLEVGTRLPVYCSGLGLSILAHKTPIEVDNLLHDIVKEGRLLPLTEKTITAPQILKKRLQTIREQGYAVDDEEYARGLVCVAVPVFNFTGKVVAAVSIAGPKFRLTDKVISEFILLLKKGARDISRRLGYNKIS